MTACDYSFARYSAAQLKAAGVTAVGRYINGPGKALSALELAGLLFGGIEVWFTFENSATDASGGAAVGVQYAVQANAALPPLGVSITTPVYFAADTDYPTPSAAIPYYQGLASVRDPLTNGCYGEGALIDLLFSLGLIGYGWESESTSFPGNAVQSTNAAIWQKVNGAPLPSTDLDVLLKADFGQLPRPTPAPGGDVPAATDVVDSWSVPGSDGSQWCDLHADGGLFAYGGAVPTAFEYVASGNDGTRYHFGPGTWPVFSYPGLPAAERQGSRYFLSMTPIAYQGSTLSGVGPEGPAGPEGPEGPAGSAANSAAIHAAGQALLGA